MASAPPYKNVYGDASNPYYSDAYVISIKEHDADFCSVILCGGTIALSPAGSSSAIKNEILFVCYGNEVYALTLPYLKLLWRKQLDFATCFGIYEFEGDFIVHGEVDISRITANGDIKWQYSGADIFVNLNGELSFDIVDKEIRLVDFEGNRYSINGDGETVDYSGAS